ncbi:hypothetical protein P4H66_03760 [Paenibacillus dokdonensis]|uniref:Lipoprotein n=1 Tax=Paenibacillus dokdonensis TaxID=2567944 RepID=A0ABU6GGY3_9BACL|nr:hypothetical protein [Paenibacillus dokdonensis]MEC0238986.1 hypothetical protein [Paenibacillus dokdonensis]
MNFNERPKKLPVKIWSTAVVLSLSIALSACGDSNKVSDTSTKAADTGSGQPIENSVNDSKTSPDKGAATDSKETTGPVTTPKVETPDNPQTPSNGANPYEVAGIDNPDKFNEFFKAVQTAVASGSKEQVAEYVLFPLRVNENGKSRNLKDKSAFIADYDNIMTDSVKKALADQKLNTLFVNYQGVMAGNGEIWFGASADEKDKYGIIAINKDEPGTSK